MGPWSILLVGLLAGPACADISTHDSDVDSRALAILGAVEPAWGRPTGDTSCHADRPCHAYCRAYFDLCGGGAFRDLTACVDACADWSPGVPGTLEDSLACRSKLLDDPGGLTSCIAAGPSSPICRDAREASA